MHFIHFTDEEGTEFDVPLKLIESIEFSPCEDDHDEDELKIYVQGDEYYEVLGKQARQARDEIRIQIVNINSRQ
jgi:hypothetical protein